MYFTIPALPADVLQQTHTIIAGTTGSGKSVLLDSVFFALATCPPSTKSAVTIDLKRVELSRFRDLPHVIDGATDPGDAARILRQVNNFMDCRYIAMEKAGRRKSADADIYLIIDELADLLQAVKTAPADLIRLARLGRAANIHIIAATQSPDRKTLSAQLTQNFTARVALRCRDKIESRQIIGTSGAELLPKYGRAIYYNPDLMQPVPVNVEMIQADAWNRLRACYNLPPLSPD